MPIWIVGFLAGLVIQTGRIIVYHHDHPKPPVTASELAKSKASVAGEYVTLGDRP